MPRPRNLIPRISHHKPTNQARVRIGGKDYYLGVYQSPESLERYAALIAELAGTKPEPKPKPRQIRLKKSITVSRLCDLYRSDVEQKSARKSPSNRVKLLGLIDSSFRDLIEECGDELACDFGPKKLSVVRDRMIDRRWKRIYVNRCVNIIKRCFKWGAGLAELIPGEVASRVAMFPNLVRDESGAAESEPVNPASESAIQAVRQRVNHVIRAMIDLQLATGMRPGEVIRVRPRDLDRSGRVVLPGGEQFHLPGVWVFRPPTHKTAYLKYQRTILIGPKGQEVLAPFLDRDPDAYCFSPKEGIGKKQRPDRKRPPGTKYGDFSYGHTVRLTLERIDREERAKRGDLRQKVEPHERAIEFWHPHQLRHNAATRLAAEFGPEVARIVLGHRTLSVTRIYVADDLRKAAEAMAKAG